MGVMDLDEIRPRAHSPLHSRNPRGFEFLDISLCHGPWGRAVVGEGLVAGTLHCVRPSADVLGCGVVTGQPGCHGAGFPARVRDLHADELALAVREFDDPAQGLGLAVFPETQVLGGDSAPRLDGGGFDHEEAGAALGYAA